MRRLIGDRRWEELPEKTKLARRREGPALSQELRTLREAPPWNPELITCPVLAGYGTKALPHHAEGAHWIAENVSHGNVVVLEGAGHGAPNSHPKEFVELLVNPHLETAGIFRETS